MAESAKKDYQAGCLARAAVHWGKLIGAILTCEAAGALGALFTSRAIPAWYATLAKPSFTPPDWVFGPVWTLLYLLMGIAAYLVWMKTGTLSSAAMIAFFAQLALNALWSPLFFGLRSPLAGLVDIVLLWIALFFRESRAADALLLPYLLWVSYALALNAAIWRMN